MPNVNLIFEIHQPFRLRKHGINKDSKDLFERYFSNGFNKHVFNRVASKCYYPATEILLELVGDLKNTRKPFKLSFSITGLWLEQDETYYHSLSGIFDNGSEWIEQVKEHRSLIASLFKQKPKVISNTELIYNNSIAKIAEELGYKAIFTEGVDRILGWRSPNYIYKPPNSNIKVLLRNRRLTDDIGYRFSARWWSEWPLSAEKYSSWLSSSEGHVINLFMDYETFGEHHWEDSGIFWFLKALPYKINKYNNLKFSLPRETIRKYDPVGVFDVFEFNTISWADLEMDVSAWLGNEMQKLFHDEIKSLERDVKKTKDKDLIRIWRLLQCSDHLHNVCTKWWGDGDVHQYFSYFDTPYQGFAVLAEILLDLKERIKEKLYE